MPYLQVYNDSNTLQIDDSYLNLYLSRKIPITNNEGDINFENEEIIGAIGNGTNTIDGYCSNTTSGCHYKVNSLIPHVFLYLFTVKPVVPSINGMQVFDENGRLVFDSNHKQAKVVLVGTDSGYTDKTNIAIAVGGTTTESSKTVSRSDKSINFMDSENVCENKPVLETYTETYTENEWKDETYQVYEPRTVTKNEYVCKNVTTPGRYEYKCENRFVNGKFEYVCGNVYIQPKIEQKCGYEPVTRQENVLVTKTRKVLVPVQKTRQATRTVYKNVCELKHVIKVRNDIDIRVYEKTEKKLPVIINGQVSTKVFNENTKNTYSRVFGNTVKWDSPFAEIEGRPPGVYPGFDKSSGSIYSFSYIILDVSGL